MIRTHSQAQQVDYPGEVNSPDSDVVPSMSLSVRDILTRFRRGTLDPSTFDQERMWRSSGDDPDDYNEFVDAIEQCDDIADLYNLRENITNRINTLGHEIRQNSKDRGVGDSSFDKSLSSPQEGT